LRREAVTEASIRSLFGARKVAVVSTHRILIALAICAGSLPVQSWGAQPAADVIAFIHAAVVPMDRERVLSDQTVIVANGEIVEIGPASAVEPPARARRIDATGRYLLPALSDMHVHLLGESWNAAMPPELQLAREDIPFEDFLFPYVAMGVTTVQVLMATPEDLAVRERIERGDLLGPRMILARMIDGPEKAWPPPLNTWVASAAEAREAVLRSKAEGYDKIKVYSFLSKEAYDAVVATAKELGMEVMGHVPMALSVEYVLASGQKAIAHSEEVAKHSRNYDSERVEYYAGLLAERGTWLIPTLVTTDSFLKLFDDPDGIFARPGTEYFRHPMQRALWRFLVDTLYLSIPAEHRAKLRSAFFDFQRPLTRALHDKGGRLLAGSDALMPGLTAGYSLHGELQQLVDVGLTPYEALRTATVNPFEYLDESDQAGTIERGKRTDLLLLEEDPLADVSATTGIAGVLMRGRWISAEEINQRMRQIAAPDAPHTAVQ
jgi:imidazolonepropionase-like amidohydrolase